MLVSTSWGSSPHVESMNMLCRSTDLEQVSFGGVEFNDKRVKLSFVVNAKIVQTVASQPLYLLLKLRGLSLHNSHYTRP